MSGPTSVPIPIYSISDWVTHVTRVWKAQCKLERARAMAHVSLCGTCPRCVAWGTYYAAYRNHKASCNNNNNNNCDHGRDMTYAFDECFGIRTPSLFGVVLVLCHRFGPAIYDEELDADLGYDPTIKALRHARACVHHGPCITACNTFKTAVAHYRTCNTCSWCRWAQPYQTWHTPRDMPRRRVVVDMVRRELVAQNKDPNRAAEIELDFYLAATKSQYESITVAGIVWVVSSF